MIVIHMDVNYHPISGVSSGRVLLKLLKGSCMTQPTILVTGATGKTGAAVALLRGKGWPVRAVVRSHDTRSERLDRLGAETVAADASDSDQLLDAMRGTARACYLPPFHPSMIQGAVAFTAAAREARLEAVVGLSHWLASPSHPALTTRQFWLADHLFSMLPGLAHTIINPGFFADNDPRAFVDFMRTPLSRGCNLDRFDRKQGFPVPTKPRFAMDDERCRAERGVQLSRPSSAPALHLGAVG